MLSSGLSSSSKYSILGCKRSSMEGVERKQENQTKQKQKNLSNYYISIQTICKLPQLQSLWIHATFLVDHKAELQVWYCFFILGDEHVFGIVWCTIPLKWFLMCYYCKMVSARTSCRLLTRVCLTEMSSPRLFACIRNQFKLKHKFVPDLQVNPIWSE